MSENGSIYHNEELLDDLPVIMIKGGVGYEKEVFNCEREDTVGFGG